MKEAQESSNEEEKSSAGDKYETGRAMSHLTRDMNAKQLQQAKLELSALTKIELKPSAFIIPGSLIKSDTSTYFIAVGLGAIQVNGTPIIALSPQSPLAKQLLGKKAGDSFLFMQTKIIISSVD